MDIDLELQKYNVSRETIAKMQEFSSILVEWNQKMNLVSKNSLPDLWTRHILDSLQLLPYLPQNLHHLLDIGSGAGFPGMILAIALQEKMPSAQITLVESITKKTVYLNDVRARLGLDNVVIVNNRVENVVFKKVDLITARAVASLDILCGYANGLKPVPPLLLLKGKTFALENAAAKQKWLYEEEIFANQYSPDGVVVKINNLRKR